MRHSTIASAVVTIHGSYGQIHEVDKKSVRKKYHAHCSPLQKQALELNIKKAPAKASARRRRMKNPSKEHILGRLAFFLQPVTGVADVVHLCGLFNVLHLPHVSIWLFLT